MIDVSIIVPIYNSEKYLNKCIDSLINQTHENIEILLINDGSNDNSEKIVKSYKDKRIVYISKKNEGIGKTRNLGIEKSKGKYVMFIDSDDYIREDCVEKMLDTIRDKNADLVVSNYYKDFIGKLEKIKLPSFKPTTLLDNQNLLLDLNLGPCNKIYKRSLLNNIRFDEKLKYEDVPFVLDVLIKAKKIVKIDDYLSYYVIHSKSETTVRDERIFDMIKICKISYDLLKKNNIEQKYITNLFVKILTDYAAQCRYISNRKTRNKFINDSLDFLDKIDSNWNKCDYFKNLGIISQTIKSNKLLLKLYCDTVGLLYRLK